MDNIRISFEADPNNIKSTVDQLAEIGKVDAKNQEQFKKSHEQQKKFTEETVQGNQKLKKSTDEVHQSQKSSFNSLNNSITQLSRELPAFTYSMQTGFLAISNNIPALADALTQLKVKNQELAASGQPTVSAFKSLASAIFSWQTGLSIGVTLLTVYGAKVFDLVQEMISATDATDSNSEAIENNRAWAIKQIETIRTLTREYKLAHIELQLSRDKLTEKEAKNQREEIANEDKTFQVRQDYVHKRLALLREFGISQEEVNGIGNDAYEAQRIREGATFQDIVNLRKKVEGFNLIDKFYQQKTYRELELINQTHNDKLATIVAKDTPNEPI